MIHPSETAVVQGVARYPSCPPYSPSEDFPEYPFIASTLFRSEDNHAYRAIRDALRLLGLDSEHFNTRSWNPLGDVVHPGDTVVLKPNFIRDFHDTCQDYMVSVITHGSIIRAVLDYVAIALAGDGRVVIADAPQCEADFGRVVEMTGLREIQSFYREHSQIRVEIIDLRPEYTQKVDGVIVGHQALPGDPRGYTTINLGEASEFTAISQWCHRLYGSEYDRSEVTRHHHDDTHEYLISRTILEADVFINLPKMKTHKKVGVTLNLKNLVGINGNKNWLPHHREGVPANGGDQYAASGISERAEQLLLANFKRVFPALGPVRRLLGPMAKKVGRGVFGNTDSDRIRSGNWYGNDTTWRMVLDLNRALRYGDESGTLHESPQRRYFSFVDGIIAGEGNGPMGSDPKPAGLVLAGADPLAVDLACIRIMGFDRMRVPLYVNAMATHTYPVGDPTYEDIRCRSNIEDYNLPLSKFDESIRPFRPHRGWCGHIELPVRLEKRVQAT